MAVVWKTCLTRSQLFPDKAAVTDETNYENQVLLLYKISSYVIPVFSSVGIGIESIVPSGNTGLGQPPHAESKPLRDRMIFILP